MRPVRATTSTGRRPDEDPSRSERGATLGAVGRADFGPTPRGPAQPHGGIDVPASRHPSIVLEHTFDKLERGAWSRRGPAHN
jgi:hypothetical protein